MIIRVINVEIRWVDDHLKEFRKFVPNKGVIKAAREPMQRPKP